MGAIGNFFQGVGGTILPSSYLQGQGIDPETAQSLQRGALGQFGLGLLSSIGTGQPIGPRIGQAFQYAGQNAQQQVAAGTRAKALQDEAAYRQQYANIAAQQAQAAQADRANKQLYGETAWAAKLPDDQVSAAVRNMPAFGQALQQAGVDMNNPDAVRQAAEQFHQRAAGDLGLTPPTPPQIMGDFQHPEKGIWTVDENGVPKQVTAPRDPIPGMALQETARHNKAQEAAALRQATQGGTPPSGFRWKSDGSLEVIPGGPADKSAAGGLAGREGVFLQRTMNAANGGLQDLKNIIELPIGASTGMLGVGASPGVSILRASSDMLRNKLSSQSVQDYNTMMAGLSRNLATIETAGLAPNGSLTTSMDSIMLREGDSGTTKLRKLAQARQIIERGIETNLANPKIPEEQKTIIKGIIDDIQTSIPFTQHDITELQKRQVKSPDLTLADLATQSGLKNNDKALSAPVKIESDADYAKLPSGATYTAPDGSTRIKR